MKAARAALLLAAASGSAARAPLPDLHKLDQLTDITTQCRWASPMGTSFDVSSMTKASNGAYSVGDMRDPTLSYIFNLCGECCVESRRREERCAALDLRRAFHGAGKQSKPRHFRTAARGSI
jgi:hypothetical protein